MGDSIQPYNCIPHLGMAVSANNIAAIEGEDFYFSTTPGEVGFLNSDGRVNMDAIFTMEANTNVLTLAKDFYRIFFQVSGNFGCTNSDLCEISIDVEGKNVFLGETDFTSLASPSSTLGVSNQERIENTSFNDVAGAGGRHMSIDGNMVAKNTHAGDEFRIFVRLTIGNTPRRDLSLRVIAFI